MIALRKSVECGDLSPDELLRFIELRGRYDVESWMLTTLPHYCKKPFNPFHRSCFKLYSEDTASLRELDCAPRGYAKSTIKGFVKPLHDVCYELEKYILFISATKSQAVQKLGDIRTEILTNDLLFDLHGVHFPNARPGTEMVVVNTEHGQVRLQAVGSGTEIRGIRFGSERPTKIILDDVEDSEEVHNEEIRQKNHDWFNEVVSNLGQENTSIEIVGTVLHRDSLLMRLTKNPRYRNNVYKAVLSWSEREDLWQEWKKIYSNLENDSRDIDARKFYEDRRDEMDRGTKVLWPEHEDYYELMCQMVEKGKRAFMKEKQNAPLPSDEAIFDNIHWYYEDRERGGIVIEKSGVFIPFEELYCYGGIDPATGKTKTKGKAKLDFTSILAGYKDLKGRLLVHEDFTKKVKPSMYIKQIFEMHKRNNFEKFVIE